MRISEEEQKKFFEWKTKVNNAFDNVKQNKEDKFEEIVSQLNAELDSYYEEICGNIETPDFLQKYMGYVRMDHYLQSYIKYFLQETSTGKYPKWFQPFENLSNADEIYKKLNDRLSELRRLDSFSRKSDVESTLFGEFQELLKVDRRDNNFANLVDSVYNNYVYENASKEVTECNFVTLIYEYYQNNDTDLKMPKKVIGDFNLSKSKMDKVSDYMTINIKESMLYPSRDPRLVKEEDFKNFAYLVCRLAQLSNGFITTDGNIIECPDSIYRYIAINISRFIYTIDEYMQDEKDPNIFPFKDQHGNKNHHYYYTTRLPNYQQQVPEYAQKIVFRKWLQQLSSIDSMKQIDSSDPDLVAFAKEMFDIDITKPVSGYDELFVQLLSEYVDYEIKYTYKKGLTLQTFSDEEKENLINWVYNYVQNKLPKINFKKKPLEDFVKYGVNNGRLLEELNKMVKSKKDTFLLQFALDAMFALHDSWVTEHAKELNVAHKENIVKFLPPELIGFEGLENEYNMVNDFIRQLLNGISDAIDVTSLEGAYYLRVKEYFFKNHITSTESAAKMISQGSLSYEPLRLAERYKEYVAQSGENAMTFKEYCNELLRTIPISETRKKIVNKIVTDPNAIDDDINNLTADEVAKCFNEGIRKVNIPDLVRFFARNVEAQKEEQEEGNAYEELMY